MTEQREEGWYTDLYGRHEARWMSDGEPTKLVRDGKVTSSDPPLPDEAPVRVPEPIEEPSGDGNGDLRRADDAEREGAYDHSKAYMQQMDVVWSDGTPMTVLYKDQVPTLRRPKQPDGSSESS